MALGVLWSIEKDVFQFEVFKPDKPAIKRGILSAISYLYTPLCNRPSGIIILAGFSGKK